MNLETFFISPLIQNLGWTLLHSLWQIAAISLSLFVLLKFSGKATANLRYGLACAALCLALIAPVGTFVWLTNSPGAEVQSPKSKVQSPKPEFRSPKPDTYNFNTKEVQNKSNAESSNSRLWTLDFGLWTLDLALPYLVWLWLMGVALFALRTAGGLWQLQIIRRSQISSVNPEWQAKFADLCKKIGVRAKVKIRESAIVVAPVVVGWLKPIVLVPASAFTGLSPAQLEAVLVHELMHIRRHDFLINLLQTGAEILLFYHPGVWWISRKIRNEREFACDDAVVKFYGERLCYAQALANLETLRRMARNIQPQLAAAANGGKLMNRMQRIMQKEAETARFNSLWSVGLVGVLISAIVLTLFSVGDRVSVNAENKSKNKKIAVGFVSIPPVDRSDNPPHDGVATAQILIEKLKSHRVPAIGFVLGAAISDGEKLYPVRAEIVRTWRDAGFEIGIGGYKHIWFYDTSYEDYVANVEKNERITKQILAEKNLPLRYFSYPFLNTGKTLEDRNRFESWLSARGLKSVPYTIDNQEWMYSFAYDMARKDNDINTMKQIRAEFLAYMEKMFDHFEAYSNEMFKRDIAQTMVLTPSRLVADTADEFFGMIEKRGYQFVSMDEALSDEAYKTPETFTGNKSGISWFERWTITQGKKLRDEPRVSALVHKTWEENKGKK